jgi:cyclopropane fatty-acyl-phospholipid synthase-like methyltransferase
VTEVFDSAESEQATQTLQTHFDHALNLYKIWASPWTVIKAFVVGWERSGHPARLHYAWDLSQQPSLNEALRQTTREAVARLELDQVAQAFVIEAGCGMGGCTTQMVVEEPRLRVVGVQLVKRQAQVAQRRKQVLTAAVAQRANFLVSNNLRLPLRHEICDGVLAIETFCHIPPPEKKQLLQGVFHLLKPGGKLVVVDGYRRRQPQGAEKRLLDEFRQGWTLPELVSPEHQTALAQQVGFIVKSVEHVTPHVMDSVLLIYRIAWFCAPVINMVHFMEERRLRIPGLSWVFDRLGFSALHAPRLAQTCLAQKPLAEAEILGYYIHTFEKPTQA